MHVRDVEEDERPVLRHVSKHARRFKTQVAVFDDTAHRDFVTGFRKRKEERRKQAQKEIAEKERKKRLKLRHERRVAVRKAAGLDLLEGNDEEAEELEDGQSNSHPLDFATAHVSGLVVYNNEEDGMMTTVKTTAIETDDGNEQDEDGSDESDQDGGAENRGKRRASSFSLSASKLSKKGETEQASRKSGNEPKSRKKRKGRAKPGRGKSKGGDKKKRRLLKKRDKDRGHGKIRN